MLLPRGSDWAQADNSACLGTPCWGRLLLAVSDEVSMLQLQLLCPAKPRFWEAGGAGADLGTLQTLQLQCQLLQLIVLSRRT